MLDSSARFLQELPRLNNTFFTSVQYSWLMGKNIHVDAGFQFTHAYSRTHSLWSDVSIDNPHAIDSLDVLYQFPKHIYEAFVNFNIPFGKKFTASAGLRISHTDDDGKLYQASIYRKHYNNLVPIVQLSYHPSENHELSYSLESGVNRPSFWDNAPIFIYSSAKEIDQNSSHLENETYFKSMISYTYRQKHVWILYNNYAYHALTGYQSYPEVDGKGNWLFHERI